MKHVPVEAFQAAEAIPDALRHLIEFNNDPTSESAVGSTSKPSGTPLPAGIFSLDVVDRQSENDLGKLKDWWEKRTYEGHRVNRVLTREERSETYAGWRHAARRGTRLNRLVTVKPDVDHLTPVERMKRWDRFRQRVRCHCRACQFEAVMISTRETRPDSTGEHLHLLVHVPTEHQERFDRLVVGWDDNVDVRPATMHERVTPSGKVRSAFSYVAKAASPQDRRRDPSIWYRPSGAIAGPRVFLTRNLRAKARQEFEAKRAAETRIYRERSGRSSYRPAPPQATAPA